ncbi:hypothetical protein [Paramicrobacterium chengjingii]|uniref:hypothetical protein n=1 Tax=Paramicrobacterium chengjingii TaxID=2769067 RepID=UPI00141E62AB|nr:hypothetical protein [Microbacterium chengjingii]
MTTSTLTDKYITAILSHLPHQNQQHTENDLRAMIAANTMRRVRNGDDPETAEYSTLATLGDPAVLATRYINGNGALISARLFCTWSLAIRWTSATVLPGLYLILVIIYAINQDNIWITVFRPVGIVITVGVYLLAAVTTLYALIDRQTSSNDFVARWTPDRLAD